MTIGARDVIPEEGDPVPSVSPTPSAAPTTAPTAPSASPTHTGALPVTGGGLTPATAIGLDLSPSNLFLLAVPS